MNQFLLVLVGWALGDAALRLAGLITRSGSGAAAPPESLIERVLAAASLAATFVVGWTLALGLVGLAGSVTALAAGPVLAWGMVRRLVPPPSWSVVAELTRRWDAASPAQRVLTLALAGGVVGCVVEVAREPAFSVDALTYHLPDVFGWLHSGHAGSVQNFIYGFPVGSYPVTNEVLLTWVLGVSRSFAPLAMFSTAAAGLALLALWRLLDLLGVPRLVAAAALTAFATVPLIALGLNSDGPGTDLPAVTWLACTVALSAGAATRPALLGPALLAAGLGIGTKTTVAPLAAVALLAGAWGARATIRSAGRWVAAGAGGGALVGGIWYLRNTLTHGWPLWPFSRGPTGDPLPHGLTLYHASFLGRPSATLSLLGSYYPRWLGGGLALIAGTLAIPLVARSRAALLAGALATVSVLMWAAAPFTGVSRTLLLAALAVSTIRYLLSALAACAVALAIAARDARPLGRRLTIGLLGAASVGSVVADVSFGYPYVPRPGYLLTCAGVGTVVGTVASRRRLRLAPAGLRVAAALLAAMFLALNAPGWLWREAHPKNYGGGVLAFMLREPGFSSGSQPIAFAPRLVATLAGPRLSHPISLIPADEPCDRVRARVARGWVVVQPKFVPGLFPPFSTPACLSADRPVYSDGDTLVYGSGGVR